MLRRHFCYLLKHSLEPFLACHVPITWKGELLAAAAHVFQRFFGTLDTIQSLPEWCSHAVSRHGTLSFVPSDDQVFKVSF